MYGKPIGFAAVVGVMIAGAIVACSSPAIDSMLSEQNATAKGGGDKGSSGGVGSGDAPADGNAPTGLPCDVRQVLIDNCQVCHATSPKSGASTSLVTWDDLQKSGPGGAKKVGDMVKDRVHSDTSIMPPKGKLPAASLDILDKWVGSGMQKSTEECGRATAPKAQEPLPCTPDVTIKASKPYTMPAGKVDQYVCVGFDVNLTTKRHVIALGPHVDNDKILHHLLLFQTSTAYPTEPQECSAFGSAGGSKLVGGWAPGGGNIVLPPEAAYPENVGATHWMLQLHYNNAQALMGQSDNSGFSMCSTEQLRPNDAGMVAFGSMSFSIPPRGSLNISCDTSIDLLGLGDVTFFSASPHMHKNGTLMSTERIPKLGLGAPEMVYSQPNFAFENQEHVKINTKVAAGDIMRTHCGWKNPTDVAIGFGENTGDEMCYHFMSYYPDKPSMIWALPSVLARCTTE